MGVPLNALTNSLLNVTDQNRRELDLFAEFDRSLFTNDGRCLCTDANKHDAQSSDKGVGLLVNDQDRMVVQLHARNDPRERP